MQVFKYLQYPEIKEVQEIQLVEFFTKDEATGIYLAYPDSLFKSLFAVNYGYNGGNKPIRGIQQGENIYEINIDNNTLIYHPNQYILYDSDKIFDRVVLEGKVEVLILEFQNIGFRLEK